MIFSEIKRTSKKHMKNYHLVKQFAIYSIAIGAIFLIINLIYLNTMYYNEHISEYILKPLLTHIITTLVMFAFLKSMQLAERIKRKNLFKLMLLGYVIFTLPIGVFQLFINKSYNSLITSSLTMIALIMQMVLEYLKFMYYMNYWEKHNGRKTYSIINLLKKSFKYLGDFILLSISFFNWYIIEISVICLVAFTYSLSGTKSIIAIFSIFSFAIGIYVKPFMLVSKINYYDKVMLEEEPIYRSILED